MPLLQLMVLATFAMAGVAILRLARVHLGRTPLPEGRGRRLLFLAFVVVPPMALAAVTQPPAAAGPLRGISSLPIYVVIVAGLVILMSVAALIIGKVADGRSGRLIALALSGREAEPSLAQTDPPITTKLAESVADVARANAVFPRGPEFPAQVHRAGFRGDWDALENANRTLEGRIADDHRLGLGVASAATTVAGDARSRLDTLRRIAGERGEVWAAG